MGIKKSSLKSHFDEAKGVTYIPWDKLPSNLEPLAEGGVIDEESLPPKPTPPAGDLYLSVYEAVVP